MATGLNAEHMRNVESIPKVFMKKKNKYVFMGWIQMEKSKNQKLHKERRRWHFYANRTIKTNSLLTSIAKMPL